MDVATNPDRSSYFPAIEKKHGQPMSYWFDQVAQISDRKYQEQIEYLRENHGFSQAHANALVLYCKGNTSSRKYSTLAEYLKPLDVTKSKTIKEIFLVLQKKYPRADVVIAWNQPMLKLDGKYVFGVMAASKHLLIAPFNADVIADFADRLTEYKVNKKTIQVPVDWKIDKKLLTDLTAASIAAVRSAD